MKIFFKEIPEIKVQRVWSSSRMMDYCIKYNYYTGGTCEAYEEMLDYVRNTEPTHENMFKVAYDIVIHTPELKEDTQFPVEEHVAGLMHGMESEVINSLYTVGEIDI